MVNACHAELRRNETEELRDKFKTAKKNLFATYDRLKEEELAEWIREVEAAKEGNQHGEAWRQVNNISGRKKSPSVE